jgi:hypothetical protein
MAATEVTTREGWHFTPYHIEQRGMRNVPTKYLKEVVWGVIDSVKGYYTNTAQSNCYHTVEFNFD